MKSARPHPDLPLGSRKVGPLLAVSQGPSGVDIATWGELTEWWTHYDPVQLAAELTDEQIAGFLDTAEGTSRFAEELRAARDRRAADDAPAARGHLRAL